MKKSEDDVALAKEIGKLISKRREMKGLTQNEVGERLGIGYEAVSRMERGVTLPSVVKLMHLADILECPIEELVSETSVRANDQAQVILRMIEDLPGEDRAFMIDMVDRLSKQLKAKLPKKAIRR
jgi:transcriptional regulator with XRE-family HTH domain